MVGVLVGRGEMVGEAVVGLPEGDAVVGAAFTQLPLQDPSHCDSASLHQSLPGCSGGSHEPDPFGQEQHPAVVDPVLDVVAEALVVEVVVVVVAAEVVVVSGTVVASGTVVEA